MTDVVRPRPASPASAEPHYSDAALDHLTRPRNAGTIADPSGTGADTNPSCGDRTVITLVLADGRLAEVRFRTFGCTAAIASASVLTELATGLDADAAAALNFAPPHLSFYHLTIEPNTLIDAIRFRIVERL